MRLVRFLARAGVASRRAAADLVEAGRVLINGALPLGPGDPVDDGDVVTLDGKPVSIAAPVSLVLHKPTGYVTSRAATGRFASVFDLVKGDALVAVGRLDVMSEGVLLFTTDGDLAARLMHPSWEVPRRYAVQVTGAVDAAALAKLRAGMRVDDGEPVRPNDARFTADKSGGTLELELAEGRNRVVRRLCEALGLTVRRLVRTSYGPVRLGDLPSGASRPLTEIEVSALYRAVELPVPRAP